VSAVRDGKTVVIEAKLLVPGDVVVCNTGEKLAADVRVVTYTNFKCDQSSLTGEPDAIKKNNVVGDPKPLEVRRPVQLNSAVYLFLYCFFSLAKALHDKNRAQVSQLSRFCVLCIVSCVFCVFVQATCLAFFGTMVAEGDAKGFVVLTGDDTVMGKIASLASGVEADDTPIAKEIHHFIFIISGLAIFLGVTFFIVAYTAYPPVTALVFGIGIIVANVPEGLLATVTVSLTLTAKRLAKKQVLVKQLEAVETLGSTTCICSDKTGTLTQNRMTVQHVYVNDKIQDVPSNTERWAESNPAGLVPTIKELRAGATTAAMSYKELADDATFQKLYKFGVLCNTGEFTQEDKKLPELERLCCNGNASDYAFLKMTECIPDIKALKKGNDDVFAIDEVRKMYPSANAKISDIPFNSKYKFMATVRVMEEGDVVVVKGAAEQVFSRCGSILVDGEIRPIDDAMQARFDDVYKTVAKLGERGLGFAYRVLGPRPEGDGSDESPNNWVGGNPDVANFPLGTACRDTGREDTSDALVYIGLMALIDPPREAVPSSVLSAQRAGVKVVMVTGDHPITAAAIAKTVNIMKTPPITDLMEDKGISQQEAAATAEAIVCAGTDLDNMSEAEIQHVMLYKEVVFARTSPTQKLLIVKAAQKMGHIVAVTGDGVNDSPALSQADIGCAMGIAGTEVSKEAADMILLSDDFSAIVDGIEEGRLIFDNLKKSIAYTLSSNIPEISPFILFIIVQMPLSLTTVLILCVDLGTDMIPAISLAYEQPESDIMLRPPRDAETDRLVTDKLIMFAYMQIGVFQALAGFYSFFVILNDYGFAMGDIPGSVYDFFPYPTEGNDGKKIISSCPCGAKQKDTGEISFLKTNGEKNIVAKIQNGVLTQSNKYTDEYCQPEDLGIKWDENWPYGYGCPFGSLKPKKECKFKLDSFWGEPCYKPAMALRVAQTGAFVSIVIVQWADLLICKTRLLSIADQGMQNQVMLFGLCSETLLCMALCYLPFMNTAFKTAPIHPVHWFPSMPFSVLIFLYDETRKYLLRKERADNKAKGISEVGFVERYTYY
jgi:sodium/potassium-transporting ATPase subunit alpha